MTTYSKLARLGSELYSRRDVVYKLIAQQLILRYRRTALGYLWTLVSPLLMMCVMAVVFANLFKSDLKDFTVFLFAGMIPWTFFNAVVTLTGPTFINNESLIKKIYIPKIIFPLSVTSALLIDSLLSFAALFLIMLALGGSLSWALIFIPVSYVLLFIFAFGAGLTMSVATIFFRDLQHVIVIIMQGLFFLSPVLYKQGSITGVIGWITSLNPIIPFIELFRIPLYQSQLPPSGTILHASLLAIASLALGLYIFLRQEKKIIFRL